MSETTNIEEDQAEVFLFADLFKNEGEKLHHDDTMELCLPAKEHFIFMKYMKERLGKFDWGELTDAMDKAWFATSIGIVRKLTPKFMADRTLVVATLNYTELAVLNRMVKIIQIEIGEENEDQQFFQTIAKELFYLL